MPDPGRAGRTLQVLVSLPVGYDPRLTRTYPVVVALHGYPGGPMSVVSQSFLPDIDALTAAHALAATIVVVPQIDDPKTLDTECVNGPPGDPQTDTWLCSALPDWVVRHLHARTARTSWATLGYSYGGWCAASVTVRHPSVYGAAVVFEGYFEPDFGTGYDPLRATQLRAYDLVAIARQSPPPVAIWAFASRQDSLSYPSTARFVEAARAPLSMTAVIVKHGGHRESLYTPYIPGALRWLAQTMPGFRG